MKVSKQNSRITRKILVIITTITQNIKQRA